MAAEALAGAGWRVVVCDAMPSPARKFLMAGRGGLNLTHATPMPRFLDAYGAAAAPLRPFLEAFGPEEVRAWCEGLGQESFTGSSGRVFPRAMKASPLLRAWLARLAGLGVELRPRHRWLGWEGAALRFATPAGERLLAPRATVLACGGASWPRLGSDGAWAGWVGGTAPFRPANMGVRVAWSEPFRTRFAGTPLKRVRLRAPGFDAMGEAMVTAAGLEGGLVYAASARLRDAAPLTVTLDLRPDLDRAALARRLGGAGLSLANRLRRAGLPPVAAALVREAAAPRDDLPALLKALPLRVEGVMGLERAISSAGGLHWAEVDAALMLRARPGTFAAGEMLDWEAPTGGWLLTACLATGRAAGLAAARRLAAPSGDG
ncbi:TIGR03862 family flavoprotein [Roseococcus sp. DSY-14]|uniref:TIGR03862 family flavoprotein n=1 Tax=Roseococcus sp. DSY-14 TaxID=3369650 RepID=UPI00387B11F9